MITLTLTPLIVFGIIFKSVIGNWLGDQLKEICISPPLRLDVPPPMDYTYTPEIALTLLNCFRINFQNITLTLTLPERRKLTN